MKLKSSTQFMLSGVVILATSVASATSVRIYNAGLNPLIPIIGKGSLVLKDGKKTGRGLLHMPKEALKVDKTLRQVLDFYKVNFNRDSYDNKNSPVEAIVNVGRLKQLDLFGFRQNAAWAGGTLNLFLFGTGGDDLGDFSESLDVVAHEFTHAVIDRTSQLEYVGESGALNESFADIMGETAQLLGQVSTNGKEYLMGEGVVTESLKAEHLKKTQKPLRGLRDMLNPELSLSAQPGHITQIPSKYKGCAPTNENDHCGVHTLSGIPNKAAALMMKKLTPDKTKNLFYQVMTERLQKSSQFVDFARELRQACPGSLNAQECQVVDESLQTVGL